MQNKNILQRQLLLDRLWCMGRLTTGEAAALLQVSDSTARRLFQVLEDEGCLLRTFGGVSLPTGAAYDYEELENRNPLAKAAIAGAAAQLIRPGDVIYLDSGTTAARLAEAMLPLIQSGALDQLRVFTGSLVNLNLLAPHCTVHLIGGEYRPHRRDFSGYLAEETIKKLHFTKCFLGADSAGVEAGLTATDFETARLNALVVAGTDQRYALVDSDKFNRVGFVKYAQLTEMTRVLTDSALAPALCSQLTAAGVEYTAL